MKRFAEFLSSVQTIVIALAAFAAFMAITIREVFSETVVIEEFGLPEALANLGYSGKVSARRLGSEVDAIEDEVSTQESRLTLTTDGQQLEIAAPGGGLSLRSFTDMIRVLLDRPQTRIEGEFICPDKECTQAGVELRLRVIKGGDMKRVSVGEIGEPARGQSRDEMLDEYFHKSAVELIYALSPLVSVSYLTDRDPERARLTAKAVYNSGSVDRADAAQMIGLIDLNSGRTLDAIEWLDISVKEYASAKNSARFRDRLNCWATQVCPHRSDDYAAISYFHLSEAYSLVNRWSAAAFATASSLRHLQDAAVSEPDNADLFNTWGWVLMASGQSRAAMDKFERAIRINPEFAFPYAGWGDSLAADNPDYAIEMYRQALTINPNYTYAGIRWAYALRDSGDEAKAGDKLAEVAKTAPGQAQTLADWGHFLTPDPNAAYLFEEDSVSDTSEAASKFQEALEIGPANPGWIIASLQLLPVPEAASRVDNYVARAETPSAKAMIHYHWGERLRERGDDADAEEEMRLAVGLREEDPLYRVGLANFLWDRGERPEAMKLYREATEEQEREAWVFARLAHRLRETGDEEASVVYDTAAKIAVEQFDAATLFDVALGYEALNQPDKALGAYEAAARLSPEDYPRQVAWADSLAAQGRRADAAQVRKDADRLADDRTVADALWSKNQHAEALLRYEAASRKVPENHELRLHWAQQLWSITKYDEALERYQKAAELDPDNPARFRKWAERLVELRNYADGASRYVDAARAGDPAALAPAGLYFALDGQYDPAQVQFEEALRKNPQDDIAYTYWGRSLAMQGLHQEAIEKYIKATEINQASSIAFGRWGTSLRALDPGDKNGESVAKYRQALEIEPSNRHALGEWGLLLADNGDHPGAIEKFRTLAEIDSDNPAVYSGWAASIAASVGTGGRTDCAKLKDLLQTYNAIADRARPHAEAKLALNRADSGNWAACQPLEGLSMRATEQR